MRWPPFNAEVVRCREVGNVEGDRKGEPPTYEVYAIEFPHEPSSEETGRVWMMGEIQSRDTIRAILPELEKHAQGERNSLVVVAQRIQNAARAERQRANPSSRGAIA